MAAAATLEKKLELKLPAHEKISRNVCATFWQRLGAKVI